MKRKVRTLSSGVWGRVGGLCAVFGTIVTVLAVLQSNYVSAETVQFKINVSEETLEMNMSSNSIVLDLVPSSGGSFGSKEFSIGVGTSSNYGYSLKMVSDPTLNGVLKRTEVLDSGAIPTIASFTTTDIPETGWTESQIINSSSLTNMWGYKCSDCLKDGDSANTDYLPVPTASTSIASTNVGGNLNTTKVTFGAKIDTSVPAGVYATTIVFAAVVNNPGMINSIGQVEYMQQFADSSLVDIAAVKDSMVQDVQYSLKDIRDEKVYYIAKLADGNVWMTQNLDHDIVSTTDFYTYANTDIGHGTTTNTNATWTGTATHVTSDTTWSNSKVAPESYDPGNLCWNGVLDKNGGTTLDNGTTACIDGSNMNYHIGNYYNWTAAVAMTDSTGYNSGDMDQSICPAGWRLPKGGSETGSGSFYALVSAYGWDSSSSKMTGSYHMWDNPLYFPLGGGWLGLSSGVGSYGYYWSSMVNGSNYAYILYSDVDAYAGPDSYYHRNDGYSVRCLAR